MAFSVFGNIFINTNGGMAIKKLIPNFIFKNVFEVTPSFILEQNKKGVIFDVDDTLVPYNNNDFGEELEEYFASLAQNNIAVGLLTNNGDDRVLALIGKRNIKFIAKAGKPLKGGYVRLLHELDLSADQVIFVGDQLFTDVLGANRMKISSAIVTKFRDNDYFFVAMKRYFERIILRFYGIKIEDYLV